MQNANELCERFYVQYYRDEYLDETPVNTYSGTLESFLKQRSIEPYGEIIRYKQGARVAKLLVKSPTTGYEYTIIATEHTHSLGSHTD